MLSYIIVGIISFFIGQFSAIFLIGMTTGASRNNLWEEGYAEGYKDGKNVKTKE